jgi:hypothetical protein
MSIARVVELTSGLATGFLGIVIAAIGLKGDYDVSQQHGYEFPLSTIPVLLIVFAGPNLLVAIGAYLHAVRRYSGLGRVMIFFGSAFVIGLFLLFQMRAGYAANYIIGLRFLPVVLTLMTVGSSFAVRGKPHPQTGA